MARYKDFKSYIQQNYCDLLEKAVLDYVEGSHDGNGFHSFSVLSLCRQSIENLDIKTLCCHDDIGPLIKIDVNLTADIVTNGLGTKKYEADRKRKWFTVFLRAQLHDGLHNVEVLDTKEYYGRSFDRENGLDEYLVPYIYSDQLEDIADDFYEFYCADAVYEGFRFPYNHVMREMGIHAYEAPLPDNVFGRMYFRPTVAQYYYKYFPYIKEKTLFENEIQAGTMLINKQHYFMGTVGSHLNTIAHEIVHWELHRKFFEILALLDDSANQLSCEVVPDIKQENLTGIQKAVWWAEWQANNLAPKLLMPRVLFTQAFEDTYAEKSEYDYHDPGQVMEDTLEAVAELFGVSRFAVKTRAVQLGYDDADAALLYVNGQYFFPLSFERGSLDKNETFIIDQDSLEKMLMSDKNLAGLIESELFVYVGCVMCINDPKYVEPEDDPYRTSEYRLTEYARYNLQECCLKFRRRFISDRDFDYEFYGQCFLSKEIKASVYCETSKIDEEDKQDKKEKALELQKLRTEGAKIMDVYRELPNSFSGTLKAHMKRVKMVSPKSGKLMKVTQLELAMRTGLSEDYIGQLCKDGKGVTLETVCALCIALHLHPIFSKDLIRKSKNEFTDDEEGFFGQYLIEHQYTDSLELCNELLLSQGFKSWGKAVA